MKLLYVWINEGRTGFIKREGFNLSVDYQFALTVDENTSKYELSCISNPDAIDLFKNDNIVGLTAIVGANGTGKTTFFRSLFSQDLLPEVDEEREDYKPYAQEQRNKNRGLRVYEDDGVIRIYHNLPADQFVNNTEYSAIDLNELSDGTHEYELREALAKLEQQTVIYFTNSNYTDDITGNLSHSRLIRIGLSPEGMRTIASQFYGKKTHKPNAVYTPSDFYCLQNLLCLSKSTQDYQQICDICYYRFLSGLPAENSINVGKKNTTLDVQFSDPISLIQKLDRYAYINEDITPKRFQPLSEFDSKLAQFVNDYIKWYKAHRELFSGTPIYTLCNNILFELCFACKLKLPDQAPQNLDAYIYLLESMVSEPSGRDDVIGEAARYYQNGINEIKRLAQILEDCQEQCNTLPPSDLAYQHFIRISSESERVYKEFCKAIDDFAQAQDSVVLKYLSIKNLKMSAGERAVQNLFSWLRIPPHFDEYLSQTNIPIQEDVLLMIDEIDLYLHPEWQRLAIQTILDQLKVQYSGKKIQILIATHSPLVLSDIPTQNCVFLEPSDGNTMSVTDQRRGNTFGANLHDLLNDAFFLNNTMGEYAYQTIKRISSNLQKLKSNPSDSQLRETCKEYIKLIRIIGDPLIQFKLNTLYYECYPKGFNTATQVIQTLQECYETIGELAFEDRIQIKDRLQNMVEALNEEDGR